MLCPDALLFALEWQCSGSKVKSKPVIHTNSDRPDAWDQKAIAVCLCRVCCKLDLAVASQKTPQVWSPMSTQNHSNAVDLTEWFQSQVLQVAWMLTPKNLIYRCDTEWCLKVFCDWLSVTHAVDLLVKSIIITQFKCKDSLPVYVFEIAFLYFLMHLLSSVVKSKLCKVP